MLLVSLAVLLGASVAMAHPGGDHFLPPPPPPFPGMGPGMGPGGPFPFGGGMFGGFGLFGGFRHGPPCPLRFGNQSKVEEKVRAEACKQLMPTRGESRNQAKVRFQDWIKTQTGEGVQVELEEALKRLEKAGEEARRVAHQIIDINSNGDLSFKAARDEVRQQIKSLDREARPLVGFLMRMAPPKHHLRPHHFIFGGGHGGPFSSSSSSSEESRQPRIVIATGNVAAPVPTA